MIGNVNRIHVRKVVAWVSQKLNSVIPMKTVMLNSTATGLVYGLTRAHVRSYLKIVKSALKIIIAKSVLIVGSTVQQIK
jgi:hypothetical protein